MPDARLQARSVRLAFSFLFFLFFTATWLPHSADALIRVNDATKISATESGLAIEDGDQFGASLGFLDGLTSGGPRILVVGAKNDDDGGSNSGALWVLELDSGGAVVASQKIAGGSGTPGLPLSIGDFFGTALAVCGDINGDGVRDLVAGAPGDGANFGAVYILFLNPDGSLDTHTKIACPDCDAIDEFGSAVASLGDLDGPGGSVEAIAVGVHQDDTDDPPPPNGRGNVTGSVWIYFLNAAGSPTGSHKIDFFSGDLPPGEPEEGARFGRGLTNLGDLDGDGTLELAVGAYQEDGQGSNRGGVWILSLRPDGTVASTRRFGDGTGGFPSNEIGDSDLFGISLAPMEVDQDGSMDLFCGNPNDDDDAQGVGKAGAVWTTALTPGPLGDPVKCVQKISEIEAGFPGELDPQDAFGVSITPLWDIDGNGTLDIAVGAQADDDGGTLGLDSNTGAVWILTLEPAPVPADPGASTVSSPTTHVFACPQGDGPNLLDQGAPISVGVVDECGNPVEGIDGEEITLCGEPGEPVHFCSAQPTGADQPTDSQGNTEIRGKVYAGGCSSAGLRAKVSGDLITQSAPIELNSVDLSGDGVVNLVDVGEFSQFTSPDAPYGFCGDFFRDDVINLADIGIFTEHLGHECPQAKAQALLQLPKVRDDHLALSYAPDRIVARPPKTLEPGETFRFFLLGRGSHPLHAWEGAVQAPSTLRITSRELAVGFDFAEGKDDWVVGLGGCTEGQEGYRVLAKYEAQLVGKPGDGKQIALAASPLQSAGPGGPAVVVCSSGKAELRGASSPTLSLSASDRANGLQDSPKSARIVGTQPNPFNPSTVIRVDVPRSEGATLRIYDVSGRLVRSFDRIVSSKAGQHEIAWDGRNEVGAVVGSGVYLVQLRSGGSTDSARITLIK